MSDPEKDKTAAGSGSAFDDDGLAEKEQNLQAAPFLSSAHNPPEEASVPLWLITFTDVMALMLTFFVLLYAMSKPDEHKWDEISTAINQGLSRFYSPERFEGAQDTITIDKLDFSRALDLDYLKTLVEQLQSKDERLKDVLVILLHDRLLISMPSELLFESGSAEVREEGKRALFVLGGLLTNIRNRMEILGHADPRPLAEGASFASNWDLSLARASEVGGVMRSIGYMRPITVRGLSSGRYQELAGIEDEARRLDLSRRVDLAILKDDGRMRGFLSMGE